MGNERIAPKSTQKHQLLKNLGFSETFDVNGRSSIADIFPADKRCGIYILHFANGDYYVGQAVDVTHRYTQHRQIFEDIQLISFKTVPQKKLNKEEKRIIEILEKEGFLLRNIVFTSIPRGESDFDEIMSIAEQESWIEDLSFVDDRGSRPNVPELGPKTERAYNRFEKNPIVEQIKEFLREYVRHALPAFKLSEVDYWSISCAPRKNTLVRLNIFWQEVLSVGVFGEDSYVCFYMARSPIDRLPIGQRFRFRFQHPISWLLPERHGPGGQDQTSAEVPLHQALDFMNEPHVLTAIRIFNLRLMRKGKNNFNRSHCVKLADELIREKGQGLTPKTIAPNHHRRS